MLFRRVAAGLLAAGIVSLGMLSAPIDRSDAAVMTTVVTDGWEWQVLNGESTLFGTVTAPVIADLGGLGVRASSPALRAPEMPVPIALFTLGRWNFSVSSVNQSVADGPVTVNAVASGTGGSAAVSAVVDGGSVEYTIVLPDTLSGLVGIDYDPVADGYHDGSFITETSGSSQTEVGGWLAGSPTHHSYAWALDQLDTDANQNWVSFVAASSPVSAPTMEATVQPTATSDGLIRAVILPDGPVGPASAADTLIARVSIQGGVGCAVDEGTLADLSLSLRTSVVDGAPANALGCLDVAPVSAVAGVPIDVTVPIVLDPALATAAWQVVTGAERLVTSGLPAGLQAELVRDGASLALRVFGTPTAPGATTVSLAIGADSASVGVDLIDAVRGSVVITVVPVLAETGSENLANVAWLAAALMAIGAAAVVLRARARRW